MVTTSDSSRLNTFPLRIVIEMLGLKGRCRFVGSQDDLGLAGEH